MFFCRVCREDHSTSVPDSKSLTALITACVFLPLQEANASGGGLHLDLGRGDDAVDGLAHGLGSLAHGLGHQDGDLFPGDASLDPALLRLALVLLYSVLAAAGFTSNLLVCCVVARQSARKSTAGKSE